MRNLSIHSLMIIEDKEIFYVVDFLGNKIKCLESDHFLCHPNVNFLDFIIDDLDRYGEFLTDRDNRIKIDIFSAYRIFSNQKAYIEFSDWHEMELNKLLHQDRVFIQTGIGPPLEPEQNARLKYVRQQLIKIYGKESIQQLSEYAWGNYYKREMEFHLEKDEELFDSLGYEGLDDWEGPGKLISDDDYKELPIVKKITDDFLNCSDEEMACITSLSRLHSWQSILIPFCLIKKHIKKTKYANTMMCFYHEILEGYLLETTKEEHNQLFNDLENQASICLDYLDLVQDEDAKYLRELAKLGENMKLEYKAQVRYDHPYQEPDRRHYHDVIKEICGMINAKGGKILVGYFDKKDIFVGIRVTDKNRGNKNKDADKLGDKAFCDWWEVHIRNFLYSLTKNSISGGMVDFEFKKINNLICAVINVAMLPIPKNFISCRELKTDRMVVYLREGPLVRKLQGTEPIEELDLRNKKNA